MRLIKAALTLGLLIVFLAGCINIPIGDGKVKVTSDGLTVTDEEGQEHDVTFDEKNEEFTISNEEGEMSIGADLSLPDSLPSDIPIMDNSNIIAATDVENSVTVTYVTTTAQDEVDQIYRDFFNSDDFEASSENIMGEDEFMISVYEGNRQDGAIFVRIQSYNDEENSTLVFVGYEGGTEEN